MSCPTCDHTMDALYSHADDGITVFHCPRCGSAFVELPGETSAIIVPKLVERCRTFQTEAMINAKDDVSVQAISLWIRLGILESINTPSERPPV